MGKILIVDDSHLIRYVAESSTPEAGHEPVVAEDGQIGQALGARASILKPFNRKKFFMAVKKLIV
ncbi:hypothetical protein JHD48_00505 [Sulfurimonas sp. SAG-AH-194-I05]|nr:hypothetical protein [Sulfurimonas sp. SAG-AH-194-I05]MDF1874207.1 hypothetical protein [Sulfurimonas sp. SAG-AH-194-I05]